MATTQESQERRLQRKDIPGQVDPDVVIPPSVRAAAEKAEAAWKAAYAVQEGSSDAAPSQRPVAPDASSHVQGTQGEAPRSPPAGASSPTEAPAPTSQQEQQGQVDQTPVDWQHRYESMRGRYDKAQQSISQMAEQIANLQNVLATVQSQPTGQVPIPRELRAESLLTPQEVSDYGEEFLDVVGKKAREAASPIVNSLQAKINELEQRLGQVGGSLHQNARETMFRQLDEALPEWRDINNDKKFISWLALPDTYSGAIRHNLLRAAWDRNDTVRSLAFFRGFLAEEAATDPAGHQPNGSQAPQGNQNQNGQRQNGKVPLEQFAAPGRAKSAAEIPAEKPFISRSQISAFYALCAQGHYRGNEPERVRLEKMIFDAQAEGRIIN